MNEIMQKIISEVKKYWLIPLMILIGVFMMVQQDRQPEAVSAFSAASDQEFIEKTEMQIRDMLKGIEGAGACHVTITLASGGKKEYVREEGNVLVVTDKDGNQSPVVARENKPEIAGVTIASKGAGSLSVRLSIIESVSTVLGIGTNKICVVSISG